MTPESTVWRTLRRHDAHRFGPERCTAAPAMPDMPSSTRGHARAGVFVEATVRVKTACFCGEKVPSDVWVEQSCGVTLITTKNCAATVNHFVRRLSEVAVA